MVLIQFVCMIQEHDDTTVFWKSRFPAEYYNTCAGHIIFFYFLVATTAGSGPPPFLRNGAVSYQATNERSESRYQCNDGFTLEGRMTTVCRPNGSRDSTPVCQPQAGTHIFQLVQYISISYTKT